jgi:hypothetical protein
MKQPSIQDVVAMLIRARRELEVLLRLTAIATVIPRDARNELSVMRDDLERIIAELERTA